MPDPAADESVPAMDERHLRMLRAIQARALEALRSGPASQAGAAARALDLAMRRDREIVSGARRTTLAELVQRARGGG